MPLLNPIASRVELSQSYPFHVLNCQWDCDKSTHAEIGSTIAEEWCYVHSTDFQRSCLHTAKNRCTTQQQKYKQSKLHQNWVHTSHNIHTVWWLLSTIVHIQCRHVTFVHLYIYVYMCVGISSKLHFWCLSLSTWYKIEPTTDNTLAVSMCIRHTHCTCTLHQSLLKESANSSVLASPPRSSAAALSLQKYLWQPCCSYMEEQQHHWSCTYRGIFPESANTSCRRVAVKELASSVVTGDNPTMKGED